MTGIRQRQIALKWKRSLNRYDYAKIDQVTFIEDEYLVEECPPPKSVRLSLQTDVTQCSFCSLRKDSAWQAGHV